MKHYYAVLNCYGNQVIGYPELHIFETKNDRDEWVNNDPEIKKMVVSSHHRLAREFNKTWDDSHGFHCIYHYAGNRINSILERDNGKQYESIL